MPTSHESRYLTRRKLLLQGTRAGLAIALAGTAFRTQAQSEPNVQTLVDLGMEGALQLTLRAPSGGRYKRPYVAVWIENDAGFPIRTLGLWMNRSEAKYLRELKHWVNDEATRRQRDGGDLIMAVSSPTRAPGSYALPWDGLDDYNQAVSVGAYWVCIETSREDGPYELIREPVTFDADPFAITLLGNQDIEQVGFTYGPGVAS